MPEFNYPMSWDLPGMTAPSVPPTYNYDSRQAVLDDAGIGWVNSIQELVGTGVSAYATIAGIDNWGPSADQSLVNGVQEPPGRNEGYRRQEGDNTLLWIAGGVIAIGAIVALR